MDRIDGSIYCSEFGQNKGFSIKETIPFPEGPKALRELLERIARESQYIYGYLIQYFDAKLILSNKSKFPPHPFYERLVREAEKSKQLAEYAGKLFGDFIKYLKQQKAELRKELDCTDNIAMYHVKYGELLFNISIGHEEQVIIIAPEAIDRFGTIRLSDQENSRALFKDFARQRGYDLENITKGNRKGQGFTFTTRGGKMTENVGGF